MTEYIHYFWVGFDSMGRFPLFRNAFIFLCCVVLVIVIRRLTASLRSGGSFFEAYRIAEGNFYIHGPIRENTVLKCTEIYRKKEVRS